METGQQPKPNVYSKDYVAVNSETLFVGRSGKRRIFHRAAAASGPPFS
ncbi:MAG: hypothetical protein WCF03_15545 [Nitrososphaeraceae archaeon]